MSIEPLPQVEHLHAQEPAWLESGQGASAPAPAATPAGPAGSAPPWIRLLRPALLALALLVAALLLYGMAEVASEHVARNQHMHTAPNNALYQPASLVQNHASP